MTFEQFKAVKCPNRVQIIWKILLIAIVVFESIIVKSAFADGIYRAIGEMAGSDELLDGRCPPTHSKLSQGMVRLLWHIFTDVHVQKEESSQKN